MKTEVVRTAPVSMVITDMPKNSLAEVTKTRNFSAWRIGDLVFRGLNHEVWNLRVQSYCDLTLTSAGEYAVRPFSAGDKVTLTF